MNFSFFSSFVFVDYLSYMNTVIIIIIIDDELHCEVKKKSLTIKFCRCSFETNEINVNIYCWWRWLIQYLIESEKKCHFIQVHSPSTLPHTHTHTQDDFDSPSVYPNETKITAWLVWFLRKLLMIIVLHILTLLVVIVILICFGFKQNKTKNNF